MIKLAKSFSHAIAGLAYALKHERNFRIQWQCALMVFLLNALVKFSLWQAWVFLALTFLVLACELFNCAI